MSTTAEFLQIYYNEFGRTNKSFLISSLGSSFSFLCISEFVIPLLNTIYNSSTGININQTSTSSYISTAVIPSVSLLASTVCLLTASTFNIKSGCKDFYNCIYSSKLKSHYLRTASQKQSTEKQKSYQFAAKALNNIIAAQALKGTGKILTGLGFTIIAVALIMVFVQYMLPLLTGSPLNINATLPYLALENLSLIGSCFIGTGFVCFIIELILKKINKKSLESYIGTLETHKPTSTF